jgi:hypothetical protein
MQDFNNKVAVITGGARHYGKPALPQVQAAQSPVEVSVLAPDPHVMGAWCYNNSTIQLHKGKRYDQ